MLTILFLIFGMILVSMMLSMEIIIVLISLMIFYSVLGGAMFMSMNLVISVFGLSGDMFSYGMLMLSLYLVMLMLSSETKVKNGMSNNMYKIFILFILLFLVLCFSVNQVMMFYLFFELVLIPMILLILIYGYQPERLESGIYMFMYTMFGSLPLLLGIFIMMGKGSGSLMYSLMFKNDFFMNWGILLMLAFLVKLPMYSLHIWLPKAHVEAPVSGSMILAGVLLKMGCYGMYRFMVFINMSGMLGNYLMMMGLWGSLLSGFMCLRQLDMKKLVAYSSIVHSGLFMGGVLGESVVGLSGGLMMMIGHGLCASGLFFLVNMIYERLYTRSLLLAKGVFNMIPSMMLWSFMLSAANMAAPPFLNLFSEILLGCGVLMWDLFLSLVLLLIYFVGVAYGIYFYSVISHGVFIGKFLIKEVKILEYLILFMHFIPVMMLIFLLKFMF